MAADVVMANAEAEFIVAHAHDMISPLDVYRETIYNGSRIEHVSRDACNRSIVYVSEAIQQVTRHLLRMQTRIAKLADLTRNKDLAARGESSRFEFAELQKGRSQEIADLKKLITGDNQGDRELARTTLKRLISVLATNPHRTNTESRWCADLSVHIQKDYDTLNERGMLTCENVKKSLNDTLEYIRSEMSASSSSISDGRSLVGPVNTRKCDVLYTAIKPRYGAWSPIDSDSNNTEVSQLGNLLSNWLTRTPYSLAEPIDASYRITLHSTFDPRTTTPVSVLSSDEQARLGRAIDVWSDGFDYMKSDKTLRQPLHQNLYHLFRTEQITRMRALDAAATAPVLRNHAVPERDDRSLHVVGVYISDRSIDSLAKQFKREYANILSEPSQNRDGLEQTVVNNNKNPVSRNVIPRLSLAGEAYYLRIPFRMKFEPEEQRTFRFENTGYNNTPDAWANIAAFATQWVNRAPMLMLQPMYGAALNDISRSSDSMPCRDFVFGEFSNCLVVMLHMIEPSDWHNVNWTDASIEQRFGCYTMNMHTEEDLSCAITELRTRIDPATTDSRLYRAERMRRDRDNLRLDESARARPIVVLPLGIFEKAIEIIYSTIVLEDADHTNWRTITDAITSAFEIVQATLGESNRLSNEFNAALAQLAFPLSLASADVSDPFAQLPYVNVDQYANIVTALRTEMEELRVTLNEVCVFMRHALAWVQSNDMAIATNHLLETFDQDQRLVCEQAVKLISLTLDPFANPATDVPDTFDWQLVLNRATASLRVAFHFYGQLDNLVALCEDAAVATTRAKTLLDAKLACEHAITSSDDARRKIPSTLNWLDWIRSFDAYRHHSNGQHPTHWMSANIVECLDHALTFIFVHFQLPRLRELDARIDKAESVARAFVASFRNDLDKHPALGDVQVLREKLTVHVFLTHDGVDVDPTSYSVSRSSSSASAASSSAAEESKIDTSESNSPSPSIESQSIAIVTNDLPLGPINLPRDSRLALKTAIVNTNTRALRLIRQFVEIATGQDVYAIPDPTIKHLNRNRDQRHLLEILSPQKGLYTKTIEPDNTTGNQRYEVRHSSAPRLDSIGRDVTEYMASFLSTRLDAPSIARVKRGQQMDTRARLSERGFEIDDDDYTDGDTMAYDSEEEDASMTADERAQRPSSVFQIELRQFEVHAENLSDSVPAERDYFIGGEEHMNLLRTTEPARFARCEHQWKVIHSYAETIMQAFDAIPVTKLNQQEKLKLYAFRMKRALGFVWACRAQGEYDPHAITKSTDEATRIWEILYANLPFEQDDNDGDEQQQPRTAGGQRQLRAALVDQLTDEYDMHIRMRAHPEGRTFYSRLNREPLKNDELIAENNEKIHRGLLEAGMPDTTETRKLAQYRSERAKMQLIDLRSFIARNAPTRGSELSDESKEYLERAIDSINDTMFRYITNDFTEPVINAQM